MVKEKNYKKKIYEKRINYLLMKTPLHFCSMLVTTLSYYVFRLKKSNNIDGAQDNLKKVN